MANPHKGEVEFEAGGRTRTLRIDTNIMCELEAEFDLGILRILAHLELGRITDTRRILRAVLDGNPSLDEATEILDEIGYIPARLLLEKTFRLAFPEAAEGDSPPPPIPSSGTDFSLNGSPPGTPKPRSGRQPSARS